MNEHIFAGQWKQMRGALKSWWGKLTDDDFERIGGEKDRLIGAIQEKYGHTRDQAQQEVERRFNEYGDMQGSTATRWSSVQQDLGENAASQARDAVTALGNGLENATSYFQEKDFKSMAADVADLLRKHPIQSLLIGVGVGYLLARRTRS
jgi:uncharacterized protein YjbJ (UPF0337 family)